MADGDSVSNSKSPHAEADKVRQAFYSKYSVTDLVSKGQYDQRDVDNVATNDLYVSQFVRSTETIQDAADRLHESLKWRKEINVRDITEDSFAREEWEKGGAYFHNTDKDGTRIFWMKVRIHKKDAAKLPEVKRFIARYLEEAYNESPEEEIVILFDMSGAGLSNLDMDLIKFVITCFKIYYPRLLSYMLIYEMPWLFNAAWKIIKAWLSPEAVKKIRFVVKSDVQEYINKDQLPEYMGGTDTWCYKYVPPEERNGMEEESRSTAAKKRVTFADQDQGLYKSFSADDFNNSAGSPSPKSGAGSKPGQQRSPVKREPGDENAFIGRLLTITPAEELEFSTDESGIETYGAISLKNTLPYSIAFKVKTTSPEKYKVRPSAGVVKPGSVAEVFVYLHQGHHYTVSKDKFLIMAMELTGDTPDNLAELWKTVPRENIMEHRLKCVQVSRSSLNQASDEIPESKAEQLSSLTKKMDCLALSQRRLQFCVQLMLVLQTVILLLLIGFVIYPYFTQDNTQTNSTSGSSFCYGSLL